MPYGQQHYPFENKDDFLNGFPADFIAEGLDQTRGWFYTLTILAVALFDSVAFKNCITTGMILAEDGRKMSKSLKNYPDPEELLNKYGGDSLRAYLINSPVVRGEPLKFSEEGVQLVTRSIILPLWNSFSFFSTYANADDITYEELETALPVEERALMDQWLVSTLQSLIKTVNEKMENYYLYEVIPPLMNFIDELTNWYIRSNRKRFWKEKDSNDIDKINAFKTLHEVLTEFTKAMAPVLPFICEEIYQGLTQQENKSIHYEEYPKLINKELESSVQLAKDIIKSVRNLRVKLKLPNKQPLNSITIISDDNLIPKQIEIIEDLIKNEVNVKNIIIDTKVDDWIQYDLKPNFQMLGPKLGKDINKVVSYLSNLDDSEKRALLKQSNFLIENLDIKISEIDIKLSSKSESENFEIVEKFGIILDTEISEDLKKERLSREIVSIIQQKRKSDGYEITDRVKVEVISDEEIIKSSISDFNEYIKNETLATDLVFINKIGDEKVLDYNFSVELQNSTNKS
jgi:isoleucyl-tRNA synthetase